MKSLRKRSGVACRRSVPHDPQGSPATVSAPRLLSSTSVSCHRWSTMSVISPPMTRCSEDGDPCYARVRRPHASVSAAGTLSSRSTRHSSGASSCSTPSPTPKPRGAKVTRKPRATEGHENKPDSFRCEADPSRTPHACFSSAMNASIRAASAGLTGCSVSAAVTTSVATPSRLAASSTLSAARLRAAYNRWPNVASAAVAARSSTHRSGCESVAAP